MAVRILLAVGQGILNDGLRHALEREQDIVVAGEANDGAAAADRATELKPDLLMLDLQLPGAERPGILRSLCRRNAPWRTLVLARPEDKAPIAAAFRAGARGVVHKTAALKVLVQGIRAVLAGSYWLVDKAAPTETVRLTTTRAVPSTPRKENFGLTGREMEIVAAIVSGLSNKEIARKFSISEDTVKHHLTNIFDKVGAYNRLELALFAIHHGLVGRK